MPEASRFITALDDCRLHLRSRRQSSNVAVFNLSAFIFIRGQDDLHLPVQICTERKIWDRPPPPPSPGLSGFRLAQCIFGSRHYTWHSPNGMIQNLHIMSLAIFDRPPPPPGRFPFSTARRPPPSSQALVRREKRETREGRRKRETWVVHRPPPPPSPGL